jgi:ribosomal protein S18 acetylase RimI-like enzyme
MIELSSTTSRQLADIMSKHNIMLQRLERGFRATAAHDRRHISIPQFDVFLSQQSGDHHSLAIPMADAASGIDALLETFAKHGRRARVEYFHDLYPGLAAALESQGFELEMNAPLMTLEPADLAKREAPPGFRRLVPGDDALMEDFFRRQSVAFGGDGGDDALSWLPQIKAGLECGTIMAACILQDGRPVSGAVIQGHDDAELAGVWTLPDFRKRGLAFAVCQSLLRDYFQTRGLSWLSSAEDALRLYKKLGFKRVGSQRNYRFAGA